ncbi:hypothetical protein GCM10010124_17390 [Pilimelia terevasa]|uniref:Endolytic murein transglycosylase n=1 Tax=Pilimelia terevasa TaxID=53372 RepID=A0A8J3BML1_9ACTN|nr:endolytic transglycosylase MltG [Pilimelia terevasa]GGK25379.1 hypothetical protein GCM10010124_17390 [Pilimelia terevasa]
MIDELGLAYEDGDRGRHRRSAESPRRRGRTVIAAVVAVLLLAGLGGAAYWGLDRALGFFSAPDYAGGGADEVVVEVRDGDTLRQIGVTLVKADVVKSDEAFVEAAEDNARSENIQPGFYTLRRQMRAKDAVALLVNLDNRVVKGVAVREGLSVVQTYQVLSKATGIPVAKFQAAGKDPKKLGVPDFWFTRTDKTKARPSLEGFLFPKTYEFPPNATAESILRAMVAQFLQEAEAIDFVTTVEKERGGISPYEALVVASLAQVEAGVPGDLGKVARVAYNRAYGGSFPCGCLEMDVTVNYWLELNGKPTKASKDMTVAELDDPRNPYNRKLRGLPPSPIDNPGAAALQAAMSPPVGDWLYFVAIDKKGNSAFATTLAEHEKNQATARANGVL